jgi:hypothetical protein
VHVVLLSEQYSHNLKSPACSCQPSLEPGKTGGVVVIHCERAGEGTA